LFPNCQQLFEVARNLWRALTGKVFWMNIISADPSRWTVPLKYWFSVKSYVHSRYCTDHCSLSIRIKKFEQKRKTFQFPFHVQTFPVSQRTCWFLLTRRKYDTCRLKALPHVGSQVWVQAGHVGLAVNSKLLQYLGSGGEGEVEGWHLRTFIINLYDFYVHYFH
jgi:hypothetical protein